MHGGKTHKLTCIISNDLNNLSHLITAKTVSICKKIVAYNNHLFDNVDDLNLAAVIDSALFGEFSKFFQYNPELRALRGEKQVSNDKFVSMEHFTKNALKSSIRATIARNKN